MCGHARAFKFAYLHPRGGTRVCISPCVQVCGHAERYEVLLELEFNADRKRMSVVVRDGSSGAIRLCVRGARRSLPHAAICICCVDRPVGYVRSSYVGHPFEIRICACAQVY